MPKILEPASAVMHLAAGSMTNRAWMGVSSKTESP
nr:MAG TPA: hypothetical protein [Caudoviricetes sp.]